MKLIVGLGNIGKRYERTRHNIGFMVVDELAKKLQTASIAEYNASGIGRVAAPTDVAEWKTEAKLKADITKITLGYDKIILAKPSTMMNGSGAAIQRIMQFYKIAPADVWVIFDDLDMPFGKLRLRTNGTSGSGHQGVNSTIANIGSNFVRVKVGISMNDRTREPSEVYVLRSFDTHEHPHLPKIVMNAAGIITTQLQLETPADTTFDLLA